MAKSAFKNQIPSVHSYDLHEALKEIEPRVSLYEATLNQISHDIKSVEKYLADRGVNLPFEYQIEGRLERVAIAEDMDFGVQFSGTFYRDLLLWDESEKSGFRLLYQRTVQEGVTQDRKGKEIPIGEPGPIQIIERKPLIETKASTRTKAYEHLPKFLSLLANILPSPSDLNEMTADTTDSLQEAEVSSVNH